MIFILSAVLLIFSWLLPWWLLALVGVLFGYSTSKYSKLLTQLCFSVFITWLVVGYFLDAGMAGRGAFRVISMLSIEGVPTSFAHLAIALVGAAVVFVFGNLGWSLKLVVSSVARHRQEP